MTVGSPPSTTATTEFVVPRSMPITFAMSSLSCRKSRVSGLGGGAERPAAGRQRHGQHAVAIARPDVVCLYRNRELEGTLDTARPAFGPEVLLWLHSLRLRPLTLETQQIARDGDLYILLSHPWQIDLDHELVLGLVHVRPRGPGTLR